MIIRTLGHIILIVLAAALVVVVTYVGAPHHTPMLALSQETRFTMGEAEPGGAEGVRRAIVDMQAGRQLPEDRWLLSALGPLQTLSYRGADNRGDLYLASFQKGSLFWNVSVGRAGKTDGLTFDAPQGPTSQDWIDHYALMSMGGRIAGQIIELIKFLAGIAIGRFARIRL